MEVDRLSRITNAQRECLRLVAQGYQYKEIAREIGITPGAVNERLKAAMRTLGVNSRFEAARLLAAQEGGGAYQRLVDQFSGLTHEPPVMPIRAVRNQGEADEQLVRADRSAPVDRVQEARVHADVVQEVQAPFEAAYAMPRSAWMPLPVPTQQRPANDLSSVQRIGWIVALAMGSALATGLLLSFVIVGLEALSRLV